MPSKVILHKLLPPGRIGYKLTCQLYPYKTCLKENGCECSFNLRNASPKGQPSWSWHSPLYMIKNSPVSEDEFPFAPSSAEQEKGGQDVPCPLIHWVCPPRAFFPSDLISPIPQASPHRSILQSRNHFNQVCHSPLSPFQFIHIPLKHFCPQLNTRVRQVGVSGARNAGRAISWLLAVVWMTLGQHHRDTGAFSFLVRALAQQLFLGNSTFWIFLSRAREGVFCLNMSCLLVSSERKWSGRRPKRMEETQEERTLTWGLEPGRELRRE